jgi:hypothetical protein
VDPSRDGHREETIWQHLDHCRVSEQEAIRVVWLNSNKEVIHHRLRAAAVRHRIDSRQDCGGLRGLELQCMQCRGKAQEEPEEHRQQGLVALLEDDFVAVAWSWGVLAGYVE